VRRLRAVVRRNGAVAAALVLVAGGIRGEPAPSADDEAPRHAETGSGFGPKTITTDALRLTGSRFVFSPKTISTGTLRLTGTRFVFSPKVIDTQTLRLTGTRAHRFRRLERTPRPVPRGEPPSADDSERLQGSDGKESAPPALGPRETPRLRRGPR
jgi:hypothetical protein